MTEVRWNQQRVERKIFREIRVRLMRAAALLQGEIKKELSLTRTPRGGATRSIPLTPPGVQTGALRRSIQIDSTHLGDDAPRVRVGTDLVYAAIHEKGGIIRPKRVKALPVPLNDDARAMLRDAPGGSLRNVPGLFIFKTRTGRTFLARLLSGRRGKTQERVGMQLLFALRSEVYMPVRPFIRPAFERAKPAILEMMRT